MEYIHNTSGEVIPRNQLVIRLGASIPDGSEAGDWKPVLPVDPPIAGAGQVVEPSAPVKSGEQWGYGWSVRDLTEAELNSQQANALNAAIETNNARYEGAIASLTAGYPPSEIATWERQREESVAWNADNAAGTPWIDIAAQARGIPRTDYLGRTYAKAVLFAQASAYLTGLRQRYESAINIAIAPASVVIDYTLPGAP
jgi:hypothetical protein